MLNKWFEITEFGNSKCPKTRTEETYNLIGNIEIEINFKIFINNVNATATFKLYNNERSIGMYDVNGDWSQSKIDILPNKNIMKEGMTLNIKIKLFKFYCEFNIGNETKTFTNKFWYNKWWNGKKYLTYKKLELLGDFIRVNAITETENEVKGDAVLLEEPFITSPKLQLKETEKIYKYELNQLPFIGSTFCLEGTLPQSSDVEGIEKLEISLMHEIGDTLLKMEFQFSTEHGESWLKISSRLHEKNYINLKKYANPIGLSVVELTVRINVEESYFKIYFNDGKTFIKYNYVAPPWMINWIIVRGNIDNVKFGTDAERCSKYISKPLPPHITKIENLKEGQYISVKGTVTKLDENILINFYYGALGWDEKRGRVVLQAKITNQNISFCSKSKENYFCDGVKPLKPKLEIGQIINMVFLATETKFEIYYDDQEIYQFELPLWAIQYVVVTGPLANIEGRDRIAGNKSLRCWIKDDPHAVDNVDLMLIKECKVYDPALGRSNFYGYKLGCGDCTSMRNKNIPCMACTSNTCNRWKLLTDESIMCWGGDRVLTCPRETTGRVCHYAVIKETIVKTTQQN
uniref:Galectin domain-containing protein n=1 Tax=Meloidogyne floridensis TaxID=298350 RepID=A0A915P5R0_9BILA